MCAIQPESFPGRGSFRDRLSRNNDDTSDFTVALINLLSLINGMGARSVPWPNTFPGRKGLTDCCFSPYVAPGARIDPLVRARHSTASVHPRDPVTRRHHRRQPSTHSASSTTATTTTTTAGISSSACLLDLYLSTLSVSQSGPI